MRDIGTVCHRLYCCSGSTDGRKTHGRIDRWPNRTNGRTVEALGTSVLDRRNEWFDESEQLIKEKNTARARMLQHRSRANVDRYRQARNRQNSDLRRKKCQQEEQDRIAEEELCRASDTYTELL